MSSNKLLGTIVILLMIVGILGLSEKLPFQKDKSDGDVLVGSANDADFEDVELTYETSGSSNPVGKDEPTDVGTESGAGISQGAPMDENENNDGQDANDTESPDISTDEEIGRGEDIDSGDEVLETGMDGVDIPLEDAGTVEPSLPETVEGRDALKILADSVVTNTSGYGNHPDEVIRVFAEERRSYFSMRTAVWYNLWGGEKQNAVFSTGKMRDRGSVLEMDLGLADGAKGSVAVNVYGSDMDYPLQTYHLEAGQPPQRIQIDLAGLQVFTIAVENKASEMNEVVFFNLVIR